MHRTVCFLFQSGQDRQILNTFVVSASVTNASCPIKDLEEDVEVMLRHLKPKTVAESIIQCCDAYKAADIMND